MGLVYSEPACQAAYDDDVLRLSRLLSDDASRLDAADPSSGDTPLIAACRRGNLRTVQYLLRMKADAHRTNKKQRSCLHCVSRRKSSLMDFLLVVLLMPLLLLGYFLWWQQRRSSVSLMETILRQEVDVNATDYKGNSSLHYAASKKQTHLVPVLLRYHADVSITNHDGETPLDIAKSRRFHQIIVMLRKAR